MVSVQGAVVGEARRREIAIIAREALLDGASEQREIIGGRHLIWIGEPRRVLIIGVAHPQRMGLARHHLRETMLVARDVLGDRAGDVIGGFGDDRLDRIVDADRLSRTQAKLGRRLRRRVLRNHQRRVQAQPPLLELFEQKKERHHLCNRGGMAQLVLGAGIQRAAAVGVDDDGRKAAMLADDRIAIGVCARPNGRIAVVRSAAVMEIMSAARLRGDPTL